LIVRPSVRRVFFFGASLFFESDFILKKDTALAGSDEVGRGPLAGPVVAATVILTDIQKGLKTLSTMNVDDSKKLKEKQRKEVLSLIDAKMLQGIKIELGGSLKGLGYYSIVEIQADEIDRINILQASLKAMKESLLICEEKKTRGSWLVDGNKLPADRPDNWRAETIIKGDTKSSVIGLASIIAKEYRDELMERFGNEYPGYGLERHAGYPTKAHKEAIEKLGPTPIHRRSFKGVKEFL